MNNTKTLLIGAAIAGGYYLYNLYQVDKGLEYKPSKVKFNRNTQTIDVTFDFDNKSKNSLTVKSVKGSVEFDGKTISTYESKSFTIAPLTKIQVTFSFRLNQFPTAKDALNFLSADKSIIVKYKVNTSLVSIPQKYEVNIKDII